MHVIEEAVDIEFHDLLAQVGGDIADVEDSIIEQGGHRGDELSGGEVAVGRTQDPRRPGGDLTSPAQAASLPGQDDLRILRAEPLVPLLGDICGHHQQAIQHRVLLRDGERTLEQVNERQIPIESALVRRSSLEDVFLRLTGRTLVD